MNLVERDTKHSLTVQNDFVTSPVEAKSVVWGDALLSPDNQERGETDVFLAKVLSEEVGLFGVIEQREPIHNLGKPMLKSRTPFRNAPHSVSEYAPRATILELDEAEIARGLVADNEISREVADNRILESNLSRGTDIRRIYAQESRDLLARLE